MRRLKHDGSLLNILTSVFTFEDLKGLNVLRDKSSPNSPVPAPGPAAALGTWCSACARRSHCVAAARSPPLAYRGLAHCVPVLRSKVPAATTPANIALIIDGHGVSRFITKEGNMI